MVICYIKSRERDENGDGAKERQKYVFIFKIKTLLELNKSLLFYKNSSRHTSKETECVGQSVRE